MTTVPTSKATGFDPAQIVQEHQAGVWRYLRARGCDSQQADDFTQETFLKVLTKPFDDYNPAATAAYLRRVAYNLLISAKRRDKRVMLVENIEEVETTWNRWVTTDNGEELLDRLRECLEALSQRARGALEMRFRERIPRAQIAASLEITEHGAKNLMQRAKKQLKTCIEGKMS